MYSYIAIAVIYTQVFSTTEHDTHFHLTFAYSIRLYAVFLTRQYITPLLQTS